ncbi:MAG: dihydrolipoamide acetyltransferase family protein [Tenuifilaceae bacterium]
MSTFEVILPAMGEGIVEATITRWLVSEGQNVEVDQSIVEVATDKVDSEIPSPVKGKVKSLLFKEGDAPRVGQAIVLIEIEGSNKVEESSKAKEPEKTPAKNIEKTPGVTPISKPNVQVTEESNSDIPFTSPLVRKIAKDEGLNSNDLKNIKGSGLNNRITKDDILNFISSKEKKIESIIHSKLEPEKQTIAREPQSDGVMYEVVKMDRMRRLIAEHMVLSKQTSPHVTSFIEVDVTNLVTLRNKLKDPFQKKEGEKLTLTPFFIDAAVFGIKQNLLINSSVDGDNIIVKKNINIGIATTLPSGNLIVPVIKNADRLNLTGIAKSLNDLSKRARENKLNPDEIQGGTFTITNLGMFDTLTGTPIINQPQVAILAIGSIVKRPVVIESPSGDSIGIRQMMMLSLSYDHRVVDGALAGMYLKTVRDYIQNINPSNE